MINPDSLVPPLDRAPILLYLLLLINTAVRMRLPDSEWSDVIIDLDGRTRTVGCTSPATADHS